MIVDAPFRTAAIPTVRRHRPLSSGSELESGSEQKGTHAVYAVLFNNSVKCLYTRPAVYRFPMDGIGVAREGQMGPIASPKMSEKNFNKKVQNFFIFSAQNLLLLLLLCYVAGPRLV